MNNPLITVYYEPSEGERQVFDDKKDQIFLIALRGTNMLESINMDTAQLRTVMTHVIIKHPHAMGAFYGSIVDALAVMRQDVGEIKKQDKSIIEVVGGMSN